MQKVNPSANVTLSSKMEIPCLDLFVKVFDKEEVLLKAPTVSNTALLAFEVITKTEF